MSEQPTTAAAATEAVRTALIAVGKAEQWDQVPAGTLRTLKDAIEAEARQQDGSALRLLREVLDQFDYWTGEPRPATDGGKVRLHDFWEVQPEMERVLAKATAYLAALPPSAPPALDVERLAEHLERHTLEYRGNNAFCECGQWTGSESWSEHAAAEYARLQVDR